jgi:flavin-dependent dehydrogenase
VDIRCDTLVIGAGPAGSMAARALAGAGIDVVIADRAAFPRDKVCGDALLPDAIAALEEVGLLEMVAREALSIPRTVLRAPSGASVGLAGRFLTLSREKLDAMLLDSARAMGARFASGFTARAPIDGPGGIDGVTGRLDADDGGHGISAPARIRCRTVVIAAGSNPRLLEAFGVLRRPLHSAVAIRGYLPYDPFLDGKADALLISYERPLLPGYGWSFPLPGGVWNVGCGVVVPSAGRGSRLPRAARASDAPANRGSGEGPGIDLRALLATFLRTARAEGSGREGRTPDPRWWRTVKGATLRTGFVGADPVRGPVLVAGESLGLTLPLTGDGIGKAMQSGLIAASCLIAAFARGGREIDLSAYGMTLETRMRDTYRAYEAAQRWIGFPIVPGLLVRRAARSPRLRHLLEEIVAETTDPRIVLSPLGLVRAALL